MTTGSLINLKLNSTGVRDEVSSFTRLCDFCLVWEYDGQTCSIWSCGLKSLLKIFLNLKRRAEIFYFPPTGEKEIKIFRRDNEV